MGLAPEQVKSTIELRRRRDQLMGRHHPDLGGDRETAARINDTYARMTKYLNARAPRRAAPAPEYPPGDSLYSETLKATLHAGAAQISALALVAAAGLAMLRMWRTK
jgi:hypothetical protein